MNAEILAVGDELLAGEVVDTNSPFIEEMLLEHHLGVRRVVLVPDDEAALAAALREAARRGRECLAEGKRPQFVVVAGGLGPTGDDITRQAVARAAGRRLVLREEALEHVARRLGVARARLPEANRRQAFFPEGARPLPNPHGTAWGFLVEVEGVEVYVLPGVPHELRHMLREEVLPRLRVEGHFARDCFLTFGAGESAVDGRLAELMRRGGNPLLATLARDGVVLVKVSARAEDAAAAAALLDAAREEIRRRLGELIICEGTGEPERALVALLAERGVSLAVAESCTGGMLGSRITSVPGASRVFLGGVVAYADALKEAFLGVRRETLERYGAVSAETAEAMARGCREAFGAGMSAAVTGIAGPSGGSPEKPVGLVYVAVADAGGVEVREFRFRGEREVVRRRAVNAALALLILRLRGRR